MDTADAVSLPVASTQPEANLVTGSPFPYRARAVCGSLVLADSKRAVRVEEAGEPPALCFPLSDVRLELLCDEGRPLECPRKGAARLWSLSAPGRSGGTGTTDVFRSFDLPPGGLGWLAGLGAFDHDRVVVEVVDAAEGDAERDITVKRFPTWGDAADLMDMLDVRPEGERRYLGVSRPDHRRLVVEGSQMLAQAIVAAGRHVPGRRAVSAHMVFTRPADPRHPVVFELEELSQGRSFSVLSAHAIQEQRLCAAGTLLMDAGAADVVRHSVDVPEVAGPYESEPLDMSVTGRDVRVVQGAYTDDPGAPAGAPVIDAWVRFRDVPDDRYVHAGLMAQFTGHMSIAAALRPHPGIGQSEAHRTLSTAINAIALSCHAEVRADRWMLYRHHSTFAGDGMTHSECRVYGEDRGLIASFSVDAMVRGFGTAAPATDQRRIL